MPEASVKTMEEIDAISQRIPTPTGASDAFVAQLQAGVTPASEYSGGVPLLEKDTLERVPFIVQDWNTHEGKGEGDYVNVHVLLPNGAVVCFNDGGSAIIPVLEAHLNATGKKDGLYAARGLRRSDYVGEHGAATTYWLT